MNSNEAIAAAALTAALQELPGPALPRPTVRFYSGPLAAKAAGFHIRGVRSLYIGLPAAPSWIRHNVRHELAHRWVDEYGYAPPDVATEEHAADAFAAGDPRPLRMLAARAIAERVTTAPTAPTGALAIRSTCPRLAVRAPVLGVRQ